MKKKILIIIFPIFCILFIRNIFYEKYTVNILKINKDNYKLKIIEERDFRKKGVRKNVFDYELNIKNKKKHIGCGELVLVGIEEGHLYGKLEYYGIDGGVGIYKDFMDENEIIARDTIFSTAEDRLVFQKICNGYFILNLKTGDYSSNLSKAEYEKILFTKKIKNEIILLETFLKMKGKKIHNLKDIEYWMTTRQP